MNSCQVEVADTTRVQRSLSAEAVTALHAALENAPTHLPTSPTVMDALRRVCGEATREQWPPELLLIAFKKAVDEASGVQHLTRGPERDEFVGRLVTMCIDEYYRDSRR